MSNFTVNSRLSIKKANEIKFDLFTSLWNVAVINAPYKTGNLRANIKRSMDMEKVHFIYDDLEAAYVDFLERGIGRNKRHVGFIEYKTVARMINEIRYASTSGEVRFKSIPSIQMRTDVLRNYEKRMAKALGIEPEEKINAAERAAFSFAYRRGRTRKTKATDGFLNVSSPIMTNVKEERWNNYKAWNTKKKG